MRTFYLVILGICGQVLWAQNHKVVVLGFDGADHHLISQYMAEGKLPHLQKLAEQGGFEALMPTNPPQTPVSWSTFATGLSPGETEILDFIKRKEGAYLPSYALQGETTKTVLFGEKNPVYLPLIAFVLSFLILGLFLFLVRNRKWRYGISAVLALAISGLAFFAAKNWLPTAMPAAYTVRQGTPIWQILADQGRTASVIRLPVTFPAEKLNGQMISGLPVPDIRGTIGKPTIYTNDPFFKAGSNQFSVEVKILDGQGTYETDILGPANKLFYSETARNEALKRGQPYEFVKDFSAPLEIIPGDPFTLKVQGQTLQLKPKQWSPYVTFEYKVNPLITLKGFGKFYLDQVEPYFKLYLGPVNLHPDMPLPLSYPSDLAKKVYAEEPYETIGWAIDTWSISSGLMDEEHFLSDLQQTVDRFEGLMEEFLTQSDSELYIQVFSFTDLVGHVLWRFMDTEHPLYQADKAERYQQAVLEAYQRMDNIVGKAMDKLDLQQTTLLVCSDHGFASFRHQFNYNTWLVKNGFMSLKRNVLGEAMKLDDLQTGSTPFSSVDWENTKAYALGLGMIYINLQGREPNGSVKPEEYEAVRLEIKQALEAYQDENGIFPVKAVYFREEMYPSFDAAITPDIRVANRAPYRVSWDTTLGGMPAKITEDNLQNWSGDHCSLDPSEVPGVLFSSKPIKQADPQMLDMCPSMLGLLGIQPTSTMKGRNLFE
ncbi:MAG: alkaline phosphatase family protein [Acidobacteria bacterium]|nr:alkaline phosphatase family protein [Acidobacteriota bacterium]MCB9397112.1 alkaline phosphatase family protein [Acidobacteriota bacterium]